MKNEPFFVFDVISILRVASLYFLWRHLKICPCTRYKTLGKPLGFIQSISSPLLSSPLLSSPLLSSPLLSSPLLSSPLLSSPPPSSPLLSSPLLNYCRAIAYWYRNIKVRQNMILVTITG